MVLDELEDGVLLDPVALVLVFFRLDAAGRVDEGASRIKMRDDGGEDVLLDLRDPTDLDGHGAVSGFHSACKDS